MPMRSEIYSSGEWLRSADLKQPNGRHGTLTLTIKDGSQTTTFQDSDRKQIVLTFEEDERKLGLNTGNALMIEEISGQMNSDDWAGTRIELYVDPTVRNPQGQVVGGMIGRAPAAKSRLYSWSTSSGLSISQVIWTLPLIPSG